MSEFVGHPNRQVLLAAIPSGMPRESDFTIVTQSLPPLEDGKVLIRHDFLGLSPSARLRMAGDSEYSQGMPLGKPVQGQAVGTVVASRNPDFDVGDCVLSNGGWQEFATSSGRRLVRVNTTLGQPSTALGLLGTSGMTAYVGLLDIGQPVAGDTVVVSAASGSVGSAVGQIARIKGCRVVGIAGGPEKCAYVTRELGFDACVDHRATGLEERLAEACPGGVDVSFENVGGAVRDAVWPRLNDFARVVLCGTIAEYQDIGSRPGPNWHPILTRRLTIRGFLLRDHEARRAAFMQDMAAWYREGLIRYREDVTVGIENAPGAFIRLLQGNNFGKAVLQVFA